MKKLLTVLFLMILALPVGATTQPGDLVNVVLYQGQSEETLVRKAYAKPWKDIVMDPVTRQKIIRKEQALEKAYATKFRVHGIRLTPKVSGELIVVSVLYLSPAVMAGYEFMPGSADRCTTLDLDTNGMFPSEC